MKLREALDRLKARKKGRAVKLPATLLPLIAMFIREGERASTPPARMQAIRDRLKTFGRQGTALCQALFEEVRQGHVVFGMLEVLRDSVTTNDEAATAVKAAANDEDDMVRGYVVSVFGSLLVNEPQRGQNLGAFLLVYRGLEDGSWATRRNACLALGEYALAQRRADSADLVSHLLPMLTDTSDDVRQEAAGALGKCGMAAESALPRLRSLTSDASAGVREAAQTAMGTINQELARDPGSLIEPGMRVKLVCACCQEPAPVEGVAQAVVVKRYGKTLDPESGWKFVIRLDGHSSNFDQTISEESLQAVRDVGTESSGSASAA